MSPVKLKKNIGFASGVVVMPSSKSLSNRAIIIRGISGHHFNIHHLSEADDTQNLLAMIHSTSNNIDVGPAGTNMRFLTSYYAIQPGTKQIGGTERLNKRPISDLVNCLNQMGAKITYVQQNNFPPLFIEGATLTGGKINIEGNKSSQFISSILMVAPYISGGIELEIKGKVVSEPYIDMTLELMKYFGINYKIEKNIICINEQNYIPKDYTVEGDWSSAAMWYAFIAGAKPGTYIHIKNISLNSLQGDKKCAEYFSHLGVSTQTVDEGIEISKTGIPNTILSFDLTHQPDLFPPLVVSCVLNGVLATFTGLDTLPQKESNRIEAMANELKKLNVELEYTNTYFSIKNYLKTPTHVMFDTYNDHRMAMSLSAISQMGVEVTIHQPEVVSKSYPSFWQHLKSIEIANIY